MNKQRTRTGTDPTTNTNFAIFTIIFSILTLAGVFIGSLIYYINPLQASISTLSESQVTKNQQIATQFRECHEYIDKRDADLSQRIGSRLTEHIRVADERFNSHVVTGHPKLSQQVARLDGRFDKFDAQLEAIRNLLTAELNSVREENRNYRERLKELERSQRHE